MLNDFKYISNPDTCQWSQCLNFARFWKKKPFLLVRSYLHSTMGPVIMRYRSFCLDDMFFLLMWFRVFCVQRWCRKVQFLHRFWRVRVSIWTIIAGEICVLRAQFKLCAVLDERELDLAANAEAMMCSRRCKSEKASPFSQTVSPSPAVPSSKHRPGGETYFHISRRPIVQSSNKYSLDMFGHVWTIGRSKLF